MERSRGLEDLEDEEDWTIGRFGWLETLDK